MKIDRICKICGKEFKVWPYRNLSVKYCSLKCKGVGTRKKVKRICKNCGLEFLISPSQFKYYNHAGYYCSMKCTYAALRKRPSKRKHYHGVNHDVRDRVVDLEWASAVKKRDKNICKRCGISTLRMNAHHKNPRGRRPDLKYDIANGITLCNPCHTWVHWHPKEAMESGLLSTEKYEYASAML
jgi:hypothetical protein